MHCRDISPRDWMKMRNRFRVIKEPTYYGWVYYAQRAWFFGWLWRPVFIDMDGFGIPYPTEDQALKACEEYQRYWKRKSKRPYVLVEWEARSK